MRKMKVRKTCRVIARSIVQSQLLPAKSAEVHAGTTGVTPETICAPRMVIASAILINTSHVTAESVSSAHYRFVRQYRSWTSMDAVTMTRAVNVVHALAVPRVGRCRRVRSVH